MSVKFPEITELDADEAYRINRARLALLLHKDPAEIDKINVQDIHDLITVHEADQELRK